MTETLIKRDGNILVLNAGSSSIKFAIFDPSSRGTFVASGSLNRIGLPDAKLKIRYGAEEPCHQTDVPESGFESAIETIFAALRDHELTNGLAAVGHRVVHGGPSLSQPVLVDEAVIKELRRLVPLDPEHLPEQIRLIETAANQVPGLPQVACFDTAFFQNLPRVAQLIAIPHRFQQQGVRRYGFHGISYDYLTRQLEQLAGSKSSTGRVVLAHLGNGASLAAVKDGQPIDTTMGFTPASGIPMGTRCGDIDPGLARYLVSDGQMSIEQFASMVNLESGLLGVSGISPSMRDLLDCESTQGRAADAVSLFCSEVKKRIGAFAAALGGLDTLVFSGGVGENSSVVRHRICNGLEFLGIELDQNRNAENLPLISPDAGRVAVRVIRTNEERMIGESVCRVTGINNS